MSSVTGTELGSGSGSLRFEVVHFLGPRHFQDLREDGANERERHGVTLFQFAEVFNALDVAPPLRRDLEIGGVAFFVPRALLEVDGFRGDPKRLLLVEEPIRAVVPARAVFEERLVRVPLVKVLVICLSNSMLIDIS